MCLLPQSFKDAITVTRNLGLRYLWIYALCIAQDSPKDWDRESSKMGDVFKNSFLTIAVSATACDGFLTRESHRRSSIKLELFSTEGKNSGYVHFKSPSSPRGQIDTRAWCLQETVLSTRVLTFGLEEWYTLIGGGLGLFSGPGYSSRHLTRRSDKLPAISGLAHEVQIFLKCNYLAGIWECNIPAGLLWSRVRGRRYWLDVCTTKQVSPRELGDPQAPSWSWAASNGPVLYPRTSFERPPIYEVNIINARTTPVGVDSMGRVSAGFIVLNGPMLELSCFRDELFSSDRRRKPSYLVIKAEERGLSYSPEPLFSQVRNELNTIQSLAASVYGKTPEPEGSICLAQFDKDDFFVSPVTCLLICKPDADYWANGLILLSTGRDGEYRRIGFWQLPHARPDLAPLWARFERRTIMLI
jgi:hypothetical protein